MTLSGLDIHFFKVPLKSIKAYSKRQQHTTKQHNPNDFL